MNDKIIGPISTLPPSEFNEIRRAPKETQRKVFVTGFVDFKVQEVVLIKMDNSEIDVPFEWFKPTSLGVEPDFDNLSIIDFGYSIKLGQYEASSHAILYQFEIEYKEAIEANKMAN